MRIKIRYLPAVAALALTLSCSSQSEGTDAADEPTRPVSSSPPTAASSSAGTPFTASEAYFSAVFMNEPLRGEESFAGDNGTYPIIIYSDEEQEQGLGVTFSDLSALGDLPLEGFLNVTLQNIAAENGGTVVSQMRVEFAGTTAVDGVIEYTDAVQHVRAALLPPGHGYTISQLSAPGANRSPEFERLLTSFKHLPA